MSNACTIGTPCHEDWNSMQPNDQGRHCAACNLTVIDLTRLSPTVRTRTLTDIHQRINCGQRVCVRGHLNRDGMLTGSRRALTGGMAMILAMAMSGCTGDNISEVPPPTKNSPENPAATRGEVATVSTLMGDVAAPNETRAGTDHMPISAGAVTEPMPVTVGKVCAPMPTELAQPKLPEPESPPKPDSH